MKIVRETVCILSVALACHADEPVAKKVFVPGWGVATDPAADCKIEPNGDKLKITIPGAIEAHDLSPEMNNSTAPTVVRLVKGDFVIQVKVDGEFAPSEDSTAAGRTGYTGAGLVVFADEKNFVRLERATLHTGQEAIPYTNFEIRVDGKLQRYGSTGDLPTEDGKPTWLRLERKGNQMLGAMSHDGEHWSYGEPKELNPDVWNRGDVQAGLAAISTSSKPFVPVYSGYSIQQGSKAEPGEAEKKE